MNRMLWILRRNLVPVLPNRAKPANDGGSTAHYPGSKLRVFRQLHFKGQFPISQDEQRQVHPTQRISIPVRLTFSVKPRIGAASAFPAAI